MTHSSDLAKLRALIEAAKHMPDAPWYTVDQIWLPPGVPTYVISGHHDPHVGKPVVDSFMPDEVEDEEEAISEAWAIMEFVADARNSIPSLVSYIETAEKMREVVLKFSYHGVGCKAGGYTDYPCTCGLSALRAHLEDSV